MRRSTDEWRWRRCSGSPPCPAYMQPGGLPLFRCPPWARLGTRTRGVEPDGAPNTPSRRQWGYGTTTRRSMTSVTPGASQAVSSAVRMATYESVVPSRYMVLPSLVTSITESSRMALRAKA